MVENFKSSGNVTNTVLYNQRCTYIRHMTTRTVCVCDVLSCYRLDFIIPLCMLGRCYEVGFSVSNGPACLPDYFRLWPRHAIRKTLVCQNIVKLILILRIPEKHWYRARFLILWMNFTNKRNATIFPWSQPVSSWEFLSATSYGVWTKTEF